jgi:hypothetical protein
MHRRIALLIVLLCTWAAGQRLSRVTAQSSTAPRGATTLTAPFTFVAAGDSILLRPVSVYESEPDFSAVERIVRSGNVAFTNFEFNVFDLRRFAPTPQAEHGGLWVHAAPEQAAELKSMGFTIVSRANNHAMDYGVEGLTETSDVLDRIGLVHGGVGQNLGEARRPAYLQTPLGRVAMISVAAARLPRRADVRHVQARDRHDAADAAPDSVFRRPPDLLRDRVPQRRPEPSGARGRRT